MSRWGSCFTSIVFVAAVVFASAHAAGDELLVLKDLESTIDKALRAYNEQNYKSCYADYAKQLVRSKHSRFCTLMER